MLPFSYATRNLLRDPVRLLQKVGGAALVVFLIMAAGSFDRGMSGLLGGSGSPQNVILLGAGSEESVERSQISPQVESLAAGGIRGIDRPLGRPAVSGEVHYMGNLRVPGQGDAQALLRGVTPSVFAVHRQVRIIEGAFPKAGEVLVGRLAYHTLGVPRETMQPGGTVEFEGQAFRITGVFAAPGTVMESEVWFDRNDLMTLTQRDTLSCVVVRMAPGASPAVADLFTKQRFDLELTALTETEYYAQLSAFFAPIRAMTWLTALLIAAGAVFGGLNMLYAAFASRIRELATLQAIGFSRPAIIVSILQESLLATLLGTLVASVAAVLLLEGLAVDFSMGTFHLALTGGVVLAGLMAGLLLGLIGAVPPIIRCLGAPLPSALRS
ncbi:MAG: ABC transporter permease [Opitutales bacterium]